MFVTRPYRDGDREDCALCLYESFFSSVTINENDRKLLLDYVDMLVAFASFALVAEAEGRVVGFISGKYSKKLGKKEEKKKTGTVYLHLLKYLFGGYHLSPEFRSAFKDFLFQANEKDDKVFKHCDLELQALISRKAWRKGLGTALLSAFLEKARENGASMIMLFTNTSVSWQFYEKRGFKKVLEKPFSDGREGSSIVYEYRL